MRQISEENAEYQTQGRLHPGPTLTSQVPAHSKHSGCRLGAQAAELPPPCLVTNSLHSLPGAPAPRAGRSWGHKAPVPCCRFLKSHFSQHCGTGDTDVGVRQGSSRPRATKAWAGAPAGRRGARAWVPVTGCVRPPWPRREPLRPPGFQGAELVSAERSPGCEQRQSQRLPPPRSRHAGPRHRASRPARARARARLRSRGAT